MKAHYMDVLILIVSLSGVAFVTFLEFQPKEAEGADSLVSCWAPAFFTHSHEMYTNTHCLANWLSGVDVYRVTDWSPLKDLENRTEFRSTAKIVEDPTRGVRKILLCQTIVALFTFAFLQMVISILFNKPMSFGMDNEPNAPDLMENDVKKFYLEEKLDQTRKSYSSLSMSSWVTIVYCLVLIAAVVAWFILAGMSKNELNKRAVPKCLNCSDAQDPKPELFLCDFPIRQMGNLHRHTVPTD